jgi:hypothetical protein
MEQIMRIWKQTATAVGALLLSAGVAAAATAVAENDLNMRTGPGTEYSVVNVIPDGAPVNVRGCDAGWCQVAYAGTTGYASQNYLSLGGAVADYAAPAPYVTPGYYDSYDSYDYGPDAFYDDGPVFGFGVGIGGYHHRWRQGHGGHHWAGGWSGGRHASNGGGRMHIGGGNVGAAHIGGARLGGGHMGGGRIGGGRMGGGHIGGGRIGGGMHIGGGHVGGGIHAGGHMANR